MSEKRIFKRIVDFLRPVPWNECGMPNWIFNLGPQPSMYYNSYRIWKGRSWIYKQECDGKGREKWYRKLSR